MDFGLARLMEQDSEMTLSGMAIGSPSYMAPEQAAGKVREVGAASDVYAELSKTHPMFKKMYDSLVPFRSDSYLWTQVAEMGFDNFMVRMRTRS